MWRIVLKRGVIEMKKRLRRIGFVVGFLGPLLFYASPDLWFTFECRVLCPWCPYVDFLTRLGRLQAGLTTGLLSGLLLAAIGFSVGYGWDHRAKA